MAIGRTDRNVDGMADRQISKSRYVYRQFYVTIVRGNWDNDNGNLSDRFLIAQTTPLRTKRFDISPFETPRDIVVRISDSSK